MNRRRSRRRRCSSRRKNGLWIALAAAAAALFLSVQPGQQLVRFLTDLIDPPEWIIVLDAGHGGYDPGSVAEDGTMEKDITLQITLKTGAILEREDGVRVVYTRNSDALSWPPQEAEDLAARVRIAQQARADMLISIHLNAAEDASASGYETYIRADSEMMFDMAQQVHAEFAERGWSHERGIKSTVNAPLCLAAFKERSTSSVLPLTLIPTARQSPSSRTEFIFIMWMSVMASTWTPRRMNRSFISMPASPELPQP